VSRDERAPLADQLSGVPPVIAKGALELLGLLPHSSNYTFLARATLGEERTLAVYKPRRGETPLWDFPDGTLCRREAAAFVVARSLGWPNVPPTVLRDGPEGEGSVQLFVEADVREHYFTLQERPDLADAFRRIALFDVIVNNADRKSGHCLLGNDGRIWVVDHGVCFNVEDKLRTVIWEFVGEPLPPDSEDDLRRIRTELDRGPLRDALSPLLDPDEVAALGARTDGVLAAGAFPEPGEHRPFPWPPV
jgi:uncharacterized repeat protein (TIGR03843 family)